MSIGCWLIRLILFFSVLLNWNIFAGFKFSGSDGSINLDQATSSLTLEEDISDFKGILKISSAASDNVRSATGAEKITFVSGGAVQVEGNIFDLKGSYDPKTSSATSDKITLGNGQVLSVVSGSSIGQGVVVESGATAKITGTPTFTEPMTLTDSTSILEMEIFNRFEQNITLNDGTVKLLDSLKIKDGFGLLGNGQIDLNEQVLSVSGSWSGDLTFSSSGAIKLGGKTTVSGIWEFAEVGGSTVLSGNQNILDLAGGTLKVGQDHTLTLVDVRLNGLGSGGILDLFNSETVPGKLVLQDVAIVLDSTYTLTSGVVEVNSGVSKIIAKNLDLFRIDGPNTVFTIDGVALFFETILGNPSLPISPLTVTNGGTLNLANKGVIRPTFAATQYSDVSINSDMFDNSTFFMSEGRDLHLVSRIVFTNLSSPATRSVTLDVNNSVINFPFGTLKVFVIEDGVEVKVENAVLKNFSLDNVQLGTGSSLKFGDGVFIEISNDTVLPGAAQGFDVYGDCKIYGQGHKITLNAALGITQSGAGKTLKLHNFNIETSHPNGFACTDSTAKIELQQCFMLVDNNGFDFSVGNLSVRDALTIQGNQSLSVGGSTDFSFSSGGNFIIEPVSTLFLERGINFIYKADPSGNGSNTAATKRHFVMADSSSTLNLDGCTMTSSSTGIAIEKGNFIVNNRVDFFSSSSPGEEAEFGSALNFHGLADANFVIDGNVRVIPTTI